jgi:tetratricopeptide (TPR) repeat protein
VKRVARYLALTLLLAALEAGLAYAADAKASPAGTPVEGAKSTPTSTGPDSLALLEKAVAKDSTKFDNLYKLGVIYLDRDRPIEAVKVFGKANKVRPKTTKVLVNLGAAYDALGSPDLAQEQYRQALAATPGDSVANCRLASSLYSQGKHQEAMDILRDTLAKKPNSYCAYFTLGVAFADAGIYRDAVRMWQKVIALAPESPEAVSAKESIEVLEKFIQQ